MKNIIKHGRNVARGDGISESSSLLLAGIHWENDKKGLRITLGEWQPLIPVKLSPNPW